MSFFTGGIVGQEPDLLTATCIFRLGYSKYCI